MKISLVMKACMCLSEAFTFSKNSCVWSRAKRCDYMRIIMCVSMCVFMSNACVHLHFLACNANPHCASAPMGVRHDLAFGPLANTCHNLFYFQWQEATTHHQPGTMLAILGSSGVSEGLGAGALYPPESLPFEMMILVNQELFAHRPPLVGHIHFNTFYRCSWNLMFTCFVSKPLAPIMEEVSGGNITASYSGSL